MNPFIKAGHVIFRFCHPVQIYSRKNNVVLPCDEDARQAARAKRKIPAPTPAVPSMPPTPFTMPPEFRTRGGAPFGAAPPHLNRNTQITLRDYDMLNPDFVETRYSNFHGVDISDKNTIWAWILYRIAIDFEIQVRRKLEHTPAHCLHDITWEPGYEIVINMERRDQPVDSASFCPST